MRWFAWIGALLFAASLAYWLFTYATTMGRPAPADTGLWTPIVVDVVLFTAFAIHHSVFARQRVRAWVARHLPAELERSVYVWIASLMLVAVCTLWQPVRGVVWRASGASVLLLYGVQLAAVWWTLRSVAAIDVLDLAGLRPLDARRSQIELKVVGPYGWVRHPIYTGWFLMVLCVPTMTATRFVFAIVSCTYLLIAIPWEEASLRATTAGSYQTYMRRVRWRLVPGIY